MCLGIPLQAAFLFQWQMPETTDVGIYTYILYIYSHTSCRVIAEPADSCIPAQRAMTQPTLQHCAQSCLTVELVAQTSVAGQSRMTASAQPY
jgi:hypothetical protein